ncbi:14728_t:CDS:2, partial [Dentiscutata heterogama]
EGEVVWLDAKKILDETMLAKCNEINETPIKYWPSVITEIISPPGSENSESEFYTIKLLILRGQKEVDINSIQPWLLYRPEILGIRKASRISSDIDLDNPEPEQIAAAYIKAVRKARDIETTYTPMFQYDYHRPDDFQGPDEAKSKRFAEMEKYTHFKAIYFGAEILCEDDIVRLIPNKNSRNEKGSLLKSRNIDRRLYLQITSIYKHPKKGIHLTGDMYNRGNLLENNKYQWFPVNEDDEEYNIDLSEVAGRFYSMWPDQTEIMPCKTANILEKRQSMTGEDELTLTTDFWLSLKSDEISSDESTSQSELSDFSDSTRQTRKRSIPFDHPPDELPKKRKIESSNPEIKFETSNPEIKSEISNPEIKLETSNPEIKFETSIPTSYIPDTEINDYALTNKVTSDTSSCLDTISPNTPTFETDEGETDGDETDEYETGEDETDNEIKYEANQMICRLQVGFRELPVKKTSLNDNLPSFPDRYPVSRNSGFLKASSSLYTVPQSK